MMDGPPGLFVSQPGHRRPAASAVHSTPAGDRFPGPVTVCCLDQFALSAVSQEAKAKGRKRNNITRLRVGPGLGCRPNRSPLYLPLGYDMRKGAKTSPWIHPLLPISKHVLHYWHMEVCLKRRTPGWMLCACEDLTGNPGSWSDGLKQDTMINFEVLVLIRICPAEADYPRPGQTLHK